MAINHPIIKYRLTPTGEIPSYLCREEGSFMLRLYPINTNPNNLLSFWHGHQVDQYIGLSCGAVDPNGIPPEVEVVSTKTELQNHIAEATTGWTVDSQGVTGIRTETTTGTLEAWNPSRGIDGVEYSGPGLTTTTTAPVTFDAPSGAVIEHTASYVTKIVVETATSSGVTTSIQEFEINHPYTNITITGTSDVVGVVTTIGRPDREGEEITTTTTTTTTTATHQDIIENYSDSFKTVDEDGVITKTRIRTYREVTKVRNPFDVVAATNELWDLYEAKNNL